MNVENCKNVNPVFKKCDVCGSAYVTFIRCSECKSTDVVYDPEYGIIFCKHCGLILQDLSKCGQ